MTKQVSQETLDLAKKALSTESNNINKEFTQSTNQTQGYTHYELEEVAKEFYPVTTPLRNMIARVKAVGGIQSNWKITKKINSTNRSAGVGEGKRGQVIKQELVDRFASFKTLGLENSVTYEAQLAAQGFDDVRAKATIHLLNSVMLKEEEMILGGNTSVSLPKPLTPDATAPAFGTATLVPGTRQLQVIALTLKGANAARQTGNKFITTVESGTDAEGNAVEHKGFASDVSDAAVVEVVNAGDGIQATVEFVRGAFGFAWFLDGKLAAITAVNSVLITKEPAVSAQDLSTLILGNNSTEAKEFDGIAYQIWNENSGSYIKVLPDNNSGLNGDGAGGIVEFEEALLHFYENGEMSPTHILMNAKDWQNLKAKVLGNGQDAAYRWMMTTDKNGVQAGSMVIAYHSIFAGYTGQSGTIQLVVHPHLPQGTVLFHSETLPYATPNMANPIQMLVREEYYQEEWARKRRQYEYGVYVDEVLQMYMPEAFGLITNINANPLLP